MTLIIATPEFLIVDTVQISSGIKLITEKLLKWDCESNFTVCGNVVDAMTLLQLNEIPKESRDEMKNNFAFFNNDENFLRVRTINGEVNVMCYTCFGSLQTPYNRYLRQATNTIDGTEKSFKLILKAVENTVKFEYPELIKGSNCHFASSMHKKDNWIAVQHLTKEA